jgi:hypothetical protein
MNITSSSLTKASGASAVLSGLLFIIIQPIHPLEEVSAVTTSAWATVHYMTMAMAVLGLVGVTGIYLRQVKESRLLGLIGYLLFALFYIGTTAWAFAEALILPPLAAEAPHFIDSFLGIFDGSSSGSGLGAISAMSLVTFPMYLLGGVLLGIATFRAGILTRGGGILMAFATASTLLVPLLPHVVARYAAVPLGLALVWLGFSLWSEQRKSTVRPLKGMPGEPLHQAPAV